MFPRVKRWSTHQRRKTKMPLSNRFKKANRVKNALFIRTANMIAVLTKWSQSYFCDQFLRSAFMIALFTTCIIYDRSPHKNVMFLSLYRIATMITVLFIRTAIMIAVLTKISYIWIFCSPHEMLYFFNYCEDCNHVFVRTAIMVAFLFIRTTTTIAIHKMLYF